MKSNVWESLNLAEIDTEKTTNQMLLTTYN